MTCKNTLVKTILTVVCVSGIFSAQVSAAPVITGSPKIFKPRLLNWETDIPKATPDLTETTANRTLDLHANFAECDMVLSTAGNYHMALRDLWHDIYLPSFTPGNVPKNWFYTTSPPISIEQIVLKQFSTGNFHSQCRPNVVVGPGTIRDAMIDLANAGLIRITTPVPVVRNQGNVILVRKGNPKRIKDIWSLRKEKVRVVTSNPYSEPGSFGNYSNSIYNIADQDPNPPKGWDAERLFNEIFNNTDNRKKWRAGERIHHREVPYAIAFGKADAGLMFYHLAKHAVETFPNKFEIVPLGGTVDFPDPLPGNKVGTMFAVQVLSDNPDPHKAYEEDTAADKLLAAYQSYYFKNNILPKYGLVDPLNP